LLRYSAGHGTASMESRLNRVSVHEIQPPAPESEPPDDGLDIPDNLQRTAETEPASRGVGP
jgi:hypothetical protein